MRVAILGANGQVGGELCLILRNQSSLSLVPICRNRLGSAFLRYEGIACRHGRATEKTQAAMLFGDCPVVANLALGSGTLREATDANRMLIRNSIEHSPTNATILYFSTVTVYGNPYLQSGPRWKNAYAREKLRCEGLAIRLGRKFGKRVYVLRLGHVCGELQGITSVIRRDIVNGPVKLPAPARKSNVVYVATIADAILKATSGELGTPGIYDLLNSPQWTWEEVYEYEAQKTSQLLEIAYAGIEMPRVSSSIGKRIMSSMKSLLLGNPTRKEYAMQVISRLSIHLNKRIQAMYYQNRAASEIAALNRSPVEHDALKWREVGWRFIPTLAETKLLLSKNDFQIQDMSARSLRWPEDLKMAGQ